MRKPQKVPKTTPVVAVFVMQQLENREIDNLKKK